MEERAQVAKKEADIHKALKQLRDERKGLQPEEDSLKTVEPASDSQRDGRRPADPPQPAAGRAAPLEGRARTACRSFRPHQPRRTNGIAPGSAAPAGRLPTAVDRRSAAENDPGDGNGLVRRAEPNCWRSCRRSIAGWGGPASSSSSTNAGRGGCRTPQAGAPATGSPRPEAGKAATADRSFVEIYAVPRTSGEPDEELSAAHWDRFTASLFMVLRLDAGQANYFDLAEAAPREHPSYVLATDAARRAAEKPVRSSEKKIPASADGSIDALEPALAERSKSCGASSNAKTRWCWSWLRRSTFRRKRPPSTRSRRICNSSSGVASRRSPPRWRPRPLYRLPASSTFCDQVRFGTPNPLRPNAQARTPSDARARLVHLVTRLSLGTRKMELQPALNRVCSKQGQNHDWKLGR